jgi:mediator of RNA polymerase II transcription subunit 14
MFNSFLFNRSGRFLLQSSENILPPAALMDCEEALNKGSTSATEVFSSLRTRSILHLFAAAGRFFGLKVVTVFAIMSELFQ